MNARLSPRPRPRPVPDAFLRKRAVLILPASCSLNCRQGGLREIGFRLCFGLGFLRLVHGGDYRKLCDGAGKMPGMFAEVITTTFTVQQWPLGWRLIVILLPSITALAVLVVVLRAIRRGR